MHMRGDMDPDLMNTINNSHVWSQIGSFIQKFFESLPTPPQKAILPCSTFQFSSCSDESLLLLLLLDHFLGIFHEFDFNYSSNRLKIHSYREIVWRQCKRKDHHVYHNWKGGDRYVQQEWERCSMLAMKKTNNGMKEWYGTRWNGVGDHRNGWELGTR